jgi:hypothetical protein
MADDPIITPPMSGIPMPTPPVKRTRATTGKWSLERNTKPPIGRPPTYAPSNPRDHDYGPKASREGTMTTLPTTSCFNCGARGWCEHRKPG